MRQRVVWLAVTLVLLTLICGCHTQKEPPFSFPDFDDDGVCVHTLSYHSIPTELINYYGVPEFQKYRDQCERDGQLNILNFVQYADIDQEMFMQAMHITEDTLDEMLPWVTEDSVTYAEYVEAIFGDNQTLKNKVFLKMPSKTKP